MSGKTLRQLYGEHDGKVSDKWELYIAEYERIFREYRDNSIRLLEIGVQNGGSLEIWGEYFSNAIKLVGCDINEDCSHLKYNDLRVAVVVGDANTDSTQEDIISLSSSYDLIIDDGSHLSSDIITSFLRYFPFLEDNGVYVVEDLHCGYWEEFQGGLFDPYSSISFFKRLADILNYESWGLDIHRSDLIDGVLSRYKVRIDERALQHVHSIEFINSMCVIRKQKPDNNILGSRVIVGGLDGIIPVDEQALGVNRAPSQANNKWSNLVAPPDEVYFDLINTINIQAAKMSDYESSRSWRFTKPLREVAKLFKKLFNMIEK